MSVNKFSDHLVIIPEDDANRQIANGFLMSTRVCERAVQVMPNAGGWLEALDKFELYSNEMHGLTRRRLLALIDFDGKYSTRWLIAQNKIPTQLSNRVYVLGVASEPEKLRATCGLWSDV